jgi:lipopolysaccharide export system permease protein
MRMGRVSTFRIIFPPLILASAISLAAFALGESVVSRTNRLALDLYHINVKKVPPYRLTGGHDIWYRAEGGRFLHIGLLEASSGSVRGFTAYEVGPDFQLRQRIAANRASWKEGRWSVEDGYIFTNKKEDKPFTVERFRERPLDLQEKPLELARVARKPEEMSSGELRVYIQRLRQGGIDARQYLVDLYAKGALAFSSLIMATIGIAFGLRVGRTGLLAWAGACIPLGFLYWILLSVGFALGRSGSLPPFLAAWLPNVLFSIGGISALARVKR